jgi:hypothetical protein
MNKRCLEYRGHGRAWLRGPGFLLRQDPEEDQEDEDEDEDEDDDKEEDDKDGNEDGYSE